MLVQRRRALAHARVVRRFLCAPSSAAASLLLLLLLLEVELIGIEVRAALARTRGARGCGNAARAAKRDALVVSSNMLGGASQTVSKIRVKCNGT
jgi:hypothetical protein